MRSTAVVISMRSTAVAILIVLFVACNSQILHSISRLQTAVSTHRILADQLWNYIEDERERLRTIEGLVKELDDYAHDTEEQDLEHLMSHPVRVMRTLRDMHKYRADIYTSLGSSPVDDIHENLEFLPSEKDYKSSMDLLVKLQEFYGNQADFMQTDDVKKGNMDTLTAEEILKIVQASIEAENYYSAVMNVNRAIEMLRETNDTSREMKAKLILSKILYRVGDVEQALKYSTEVQTFFEKNQRNAEILTSLNSTIEEYKLHLSSSIPYNYDIGPGFENLIELCRGETVQIENESPGPLRCYLKTNNNPLLLLAPAKVEELHHGVGLSYYHDVLTENEINLLKELATDYLEDSELVAPANESVDYRSRSSNTAWVDDEDDERILAISRRVGAMTGLDLSYTEPFQVLSYGVGGFYDPHYDCNHIKVPSEIDYESELGGDRIATWIFYLNDIAKGGATVFPKIGAAVWPRKGGAAFWWNLHRNGTTNGQTLHAACPVLEGFKWEQKLGKSYMTITRTDNEDDT